LLYLVFRHYEKAVTGTKARPHKKTAQRQTPAP